MDKKKALGRGLGALFDRDGDAAAEEIRKPAVYEHPKPEGVTMIDIRLIEPNRLQPRQHFDDESLAELAESIKEYGVIQPLIVKDRGGHYAIVAGERRFRAARIAKLEALPVIVKDYSEMESLQIALIENIQREDLTPIEEATCYKRLMEDFFFSQEDIAQKIGKNRFAVSQTVRLLELDERVQALVNEGKLTASHARVLLTIKDGDAQYMLANKIALEGISVRAAEMLAASLQKEKKPEPPKEDENILQAYRTAEDELKSLLGAKVNIHHGKNKGKIEIEYYSPDELDRLLLLFKTLDTAR